MNSIQFWSDEFKNTAIAGEELMAQDPNRAAAIHKAVEGGLSPRLAAEMFVVDVETVASLMAFKPEFEQQLDDLIRGEIRVGMFVLAQRLAHRAFEVEESRIPAALKQLTEVERLLGDKPTKIVETREAALPDPEELWKAAIKEADVVDVG